MRGTYTGTATSFLMTEEKKKRRNEEKKKNKKMRNPGLYDREKKEFMIIH